MSPEIWKSIPGYEGLYEASDMGRIRSIDRIVKNSDGGPKHLKGKILSQANIQSTNGCYKVVTMSREGKTKSLAVHNLILLTFVGRRPSGLQCCHCDGNPENNRLDNLRWDTISSNFIDKKKHKLTRVKKPVINLELSQGSKSRAQELKDILTIDELCRLFDTIPEVITKIL